MKTTATSPTKNGVPVDKTDALKLFGVPLRWISLVALTFQTSWQVFVIKFGRVGNSQYLNSSVIVFAEMLKMILSIAFLIYEKGSFAAAASTLPKRTWHDCLELLKVSVPALAYVAQNNLIFCSLDKLSAAVQQVTYQLKMFTAAFLSIVMLGKQLSLSKWCSLVLLFIGVSFVQLPQGTFSNSPAPSPETEASRPQKGDFDAFLGFIAVLAACFVSGFAGVYTEKMLKGSDSIWLRNAQIGFFGMLTALATAFVQDGAEIYKGGFMQGYSWRVGLVIFALASGGLLVAVVLKYADNLSRQFCTAISIIITSVYSSLFFQDVDLSAQFVLGAFLTIVATFLYSLGFPQRFVKTKAT